MLEQLYESNEYGEDEKDIQVLNHSLLGIIKRQLGRTHDEKMDGLRILEETKDIEKE